MISSIPSPSASAVWESDTGLRPFLDGPDSKFYQNPILHADYSDPDVVRHGDDFFMTSSSFNCTPGLPILHSKDLVNWKLINHAVKKLPHPRFNQVQHGQGIWAPSIRYHGNKFWIFFPMPDEGIYIVTADNPAGTWSEPHLLVAGKGLIDPCPLWDDDGKAYLVHAYAGSRAGIKHRLRVRPMAPDGSHLLGEGEIVFHDPDRHPTLEGPKFLKKDGWYYILAPAGGVATGWQLALRSRHVFGPYDDRILLQQGRTPINGPHQGALVDLPNGEWWFIHFQDAGAYGRILHLQPVTWRDGWPLMGDLSIDKDIGWPVLRNIRPTTTQSSAPEPVSLRDEFDRRSLDLHWQWHANHSDSWYTLTANPGWLRLYAQCLLDGDLAKSGNLLLQKFPARSFRVETRISFHPQEEGDTAGLIIMGSQHAMIAIRRGRNGINRIVYVVNNVEVQAIDWSTHEIDVQVRVDDGGICRFAFKNTDGIFCPTLDPFIAKPGMWIGAKVGLVTTSLVEGSTACADFDYFRISAED